MKIIKKNWIPIKEFLADPLVNMDIAQVYNKIRRRKWYDGFVVKKGNDSGRWEFGCLEDYKECKGI